MVKNAQKMVKVYKYALKEKVKLHIFDEERDFGGFIKLKYRVITGEVQRGSDTCQKRLFAVRVDD